MIKLVVFDIAGTTVKDNGNVAGCFIDAFRKNGLEVRNEEVSRLMGYRKKEAIQTMLENQGVNDPLLTIRIHDDFTSSMITFYENDPSIVPLPHAEAVFSFLKSRHINVALNTGFTRPITAAIIKKLGWDSGSIIDCIVCSDEVEQGRPSPHMIQRIMDELQVKSAADVVKVGDTEVDIREGRNSGCGMVVGITTGAFSRDQLEPYEPDHIIDSLSQLPLLLNQAK